MLSPEPMRHLSLVVLSSDLEMTLRVIARIGVLHLLNVRHSAETLSAVRPYDVSERLAQLERMLRTLDGMLGFLGVAAADVPAADQKGIDLRAVEARVAAIAGEVDSLRTRLIQIGDDRQQLENLLRNLEALAPLGVPLEELRRVRFVSLACGFIPERNLSRLHDSLTRVPHLIVPGGSAGADGRVLVTALCLRSGEQQLQRALRSAQFEAVEMPPHLTGKPEEAIAQVEAQLRVAHAASASGDAERGALAQCLAPELRQLRSLAEHERLLVEARGLMGQSERVTLISGWVPAVLAAHLEQGIRQATGDRCVVHWREPSALEDVRRGRIRVPILMHNPLLIRPFESLLRAYGLPRYGEVDPTVVVAFGFLAMFGFMFGDVGQGAVLFAIGYFIYRRMFRYRDYAVILMECGVFAIGFGFLYGSIFGVEDWLPALWLRPLTDMTRLMKTALLFGAAFLSVGLLLNLVNAVRRRDVAALWERNGVLAALAYWVAVGLFVRRLTSGPGAVTLGTVVLWLALPIGLILLKDPARALWKAHHMGTRLGASEIFALVIESFVELIDTVISIVSNTATFIRLAAFALSHAGLFLATFSVADAVARAGGGTLGAAAVIVLGNAVIIGLEGLIVSIQTVRLEYYEFFSKFYSGAGEEYRPLRLTSQSDHG